MYIYIYHVHCICNDSLGGANWPSGSAFFTGQVTFECFTQVAALLHLLAAGVAMLRGLMSWMWPPKTRNVFVDGKSWHVFGLMLDQ